MSFIANSPMMETAGWLSVTPAVSAALYTAGDCVGGKQTLSNVCKASTNGAVRLSDILVVDKGNQKAQMSFLFFGAALTGTYADKTALALAANLDNLVGRAAVAAADYVTLGSDSMAVANVGNLNLLLPNLESTQSLYLVVLTSGTPTYAAVDNIRWFFKFSQTF